MTERLLVGIKSLRSTLSSQDELSAHYANFTSRDLLIKVGKISLLEELDQVETALGQAPERPEKALLEKFWHAYATLSSAAQSHNFQIALGPRARLKLGEMLLDDQNTREAKEHVQALRRLSQELQTQTRQFAHELSALGVETGVVAVRVTSPRIAPEKLAKEWRELLEKTLSASDGLPEDGYLTSEQNVDDVRRQLRAALSAAKEPGAETLTENCLKEMLAAQLLLISQRDAFMDEIAISDGISVIAKRFPDSRAKQDLLIEIEGEQERARTHLKLFNADTASAWATLRKLRNLQQPSR